MQNRKQKTENRSELNFSIFNIQYSKFNLRGFSLLELLIVISVMSILASAGVAFYRGYSKSVELSSTVQILSADLRSVQAKSMAGEGGRKWGAHLVSNTPSYYELFSTPTNYNDAGKTIISTTTLSTSIVFSDPTAGMTKDVLFGKITGTTTATTIGVTSEGITQTLTITSLGTIY